MRLRMVWWLAGLCLVALATVGAPAASAAGGADSVAMYSDAGALGGGVQHVYTDANANFSIWGSDSLVYVTIMGPGGSSMETQFVAPTGGTLTPGVYAGIDGSGFGGAGMAGMSITDEEGCDFPRGQFQIMDIGTDATGNVDRLWVVFEQHCQGSPAAVFGEVRYGEPPTDDVLDPSPSIVRWPDDLYGTPETTVPVQFTAETQTMIQSVSLGGDDPSQFVIKSDGCTGETLAAGQACDVYVDSTPGAPGITQADLDVTDATGTVHTVPLQGWTDGGSNQLTITSQEGDPVGDGLDYSYTPSDLYFGVYGTPEGVNFNLWDFGGGDNWQGGFSPAEGDILTQGTTYTYDSSLEGDQPGLAILHAGGCGGPATGQFTITSIGFSLTGQVENLGVEFSQQCVDSGAGLQGQFDWRLDDTTPLPPWMQATSDTGTGGSGGSGSGGSGGGVSSGGSASPGGSPATTGSTPVSDPTAASTGSTSPTAQPSASPTASSNGPTTTPAAVKPVARSEQTIPRSFGAHPAARKVADVLDDVSTMLVDDLSARTSSGASELESTISGLGRLLATYRPRSRDTRSAWTQLRADVAACKHSLQTKHPSATAAQRLAKTVLRADQRVAKLLA